MKASDVLTARALRQHGFRPDDDVIVRRELWSHQFGRDSAIVDSLFVYLADPVQADIAAEAKAAGVAVGGAVHILNTPGASRSILRAGWRR